jgi:hypothetical protein
METSSKVQAKAWSLTSPGFLLFLALASSAIAWWLIALPVVKFANTDKHLGHFALVYVHMIGGTIMLAFGAANLFIGSTRKYFRFHRFIGTTYLLAGSIAAAVALVLGLGHVHNQSLAFTFDLATVSNSGIAVSTLALAWLTTAAMGYRAARNKRFDNHRAWMMRSYVLAWSFVFCRIASRVPEVGNLGSGEAFIWLSWVAPLIICEVFLQWRAGSNYAIKGTSA